MNQYSFALDMPQDFLAHQGIKGQKWGLRRYQYLDGTLTPLGKERYRKDSAFQEKYNKKIKKNQKKANTNLKRSIRETSRANSFTSRFVLRNSQKHYNKAVYYNTRYLKFSNRVNSMNASVTNALATVMNKEINDD